MQEESGCVRCCAGRSAPHMSPPAPVTPVRQTSAASPASPATPGPAVTNESLAWELLYDLNFQLPTEEAESSWRDATEETDVMRESPTPPEGLSHPKTAAATARRVRRIAEKAFWDSMTGALEPWEIPRHEIFELDDEGWARF